jgi:HEPN domain-containing protein/predicted nucleotidyltransferase
MKKSLSHLPKHKQDEIRAVAELIKERIDAEFIILFGSYARGDWVEDVYVGEDGTTYEYKSDYDLLIVVDNLQKYEYKGHRNRIKQKVRRRGICDTRLSIIMHSIDEFKDAIKNGNYFFTDIKKEGILLYSSKRFRMPAVKELNVKQREGKAKKHFADWFESAKGFLKGFNFYLGEEDYKLAAFSLHQAVERFYTTILLVFTDYKPKTHDLEELGIRVDRLSAKFKEIFLKKSEEEKRLFELLRHAYVEARYDMAYKITKEELEYLAGRVKKLQSTTEKACKEKIDSFTI